MVAPVKVFDDAANNAGFDFGGRQTVVLSDGTLLVGIFSASNTAIYIYHTPDRITFTLKNSITTVANSNFTMCVEDTGDHYGIAYNPTGGSREYQGISFQRFAKGAGYTWTSGGAEVVEAINVNFNAGSFDVEALATAGMYVIAYHIVDSTSGTQEQIAYKVRVNATTYSTRTLMYYYNPSSVFSADAVTVSADSAGAVSGVQRIFIAGFSNSSGGTGTGRIWVATAAITLSTGASGAFVYVAGQSLAGIAGGSGFYDKCQSFRAGSAAWYLMFNLTNPNTGVTVFYPYYFSWDGTNLNSSPGFSSAISSDNLLVCRPAFGVLAVAGGTYKKVAAFTRRSAGGVYAAVYDFNTATWSGDFVFSNTTAYTSSIGAGATKDTGTAYTIDVVFQDTPNGDTYFDFNQAPITPTTGLTPVAGSTVNTSTPTVGVILPLLQSTTFRRKAIWQVANDSGFTTGLQTFTEPDTSLNAQGAHTLVVPNANRVSQGTRYIRAATIDAFGKTSAYMANQSFTISHPPTAINLTPSGGIARNFAGTGITAVGWTFSDTSPTDVETAYQVTVQRNDTGTSVYDSGKVTSSALTANVTIPAANKDMLLRWKMILWDTDNVQGPDSAFATFVISDPPTVTITAPLDGGTADNPSPVVTWTFSAPGGRTQVNYRVVIALDGSPATIIYDSGTLSGNALSYTFPYPILANATNYTVQVTVTDSGGLVSAFLNHFVTAWTPPANPTFTVDGSSYNNNGYVLVSWTNAAKDANFVAWRVYRAPAGTGSWSMLYEITSDQSSYTYQDWLAPAGGNYDYLVIQVANRFGVAVTGNFTGSVSVNLVGGDYWLLHPTIPSYNCRLAIVKTDDFSEQYEEAEMNIIGRGRKKDYGTRWGFKGQLVAEVWDRPDLTARQQRLNLQTLKAQKREVYLRNPFGDLWLVAMGEVGISRVAGVGPYEFVVVTLPYSEVS